MLSDRIQGLLSQELPSGYSIWVASGKIVRNRVGKMSGTGTSLEPQREGCSSPAVCGHHPTSVPLCQPMMGSGHRKWNGQESPESHKFPLPLHTIMPHQHLLVPSQTLPSLPFSASSPFLKHTLPQDVLIQERKKINLRHCLGGSVFPAVRKVLLLGTFYHCSQRAKQARSHIYHEHV